MEVCETLHKAFDMRRVSVKDFWNWIWPMDRAVRIKDAVHGPISKTHTDDICERASCFTVIDADNVVQWFMIRMWK